jgi:hypothetical protein
LPIGALLLFAVPRIQRRILMVRYLAGEENEGVATRQRKYGVKGMMVLHQWLCAVMLLLC